jgi:hypothetical protein
MEKPPMKFTPTELYKMQQGKELDSTIMYLVQKVMQDATDKVLLLGLEAYSPALAKLGIEALRPHLISEPSHQEGLALIRYKPTGDAIMFIGGAELSPGKYSDVSKITITVAHEIIKAEDRKWLSRSENQA